MRGSRSIIFYAWLALAVQLLLVVGVVIFVLAGAAYQSAAIGALQHRVQRMQLQNLTLKSDFLDAQRALSGYQATRQNRFITSFYAEQGAFVLDLARLRRLAWPGVLGLLKAETRAASAAFRSGDRAVTAPQRSRRAAGRYALASASADRFLAENDALQRRLARESDMFAARSQRTLGIGSGGTAAVLVAGLTLPVIAAALALRWTSGPLHDVTAVIRGRAAGDYAARAQPGGPGDVRELAESLNTLADEGDRLRDAERERSRLLEVVRAVSVRIRGHLHADAVLHEVVAALGQQLAVDVVWVGVISGGEMRIAETRDSGREQAVDKAEPLPPGFRALAGALFRQQASYPIQDLRAAPPADMPPPIRELLLGMGVVSVLLTPFGVGDELLGALILLRKLPHRPWTRPEIEAVEALTGDVGQALDHAQVYEREEQLVAELQALDRAKTGFLASASHDLRTPLTSVIGYVEMVQDGEAGPVTDKQAQMLATISRNVHRLGNLIEDMLTISKIELGAFSSDLQPVDLARLIPDPVDIVMPSAAAAGLTFEVACPEEGLPVEGDASQLERVVMNLLTNAVKYTPSGGRVALTATSAGGHAVVAVQDTGIGIPEEEQPSLFTPFFRASNAVDRAITGSGLGLSIVRSIIEQHHGDIELRSGRDQGTTVTVRIPLRHGEPAGPPRGVSR